MLRSLGERNHTLAEQSAAATEGHQRQMEKTGEARGAADVLRTELTAAREAAAAAAARAEVGLYKY